MSSTGLAAVFAFCAGLGGAVQIAVQGKLGGVMSAVIVLSITVAGPWLRALLLKLNQNPESPHLSDERLV